LPKIAEFYGIAIYMYYRDHGVPHFHAIYGDHEAVIAIQGFRVLEGQLPRRALALVRAWANYMTMNFKGIGNWRGPTGRCSRLRPWSEEPYQ